MNEREATMTPEEADPLTNVDGTAYHSDEWWAGNAAGGSAVAHKAQEQFDEYEREIAELRAALAECQGEPDGKDLPAIDYNAGWDAGYASARERAFEDLRTRRVQGGSAVLWAAVVAALGQPE
jgi:hypothetical protein